MTSPLLENWGSLAPGETSCKLFAQSLASMLVVYIKTWLIVNSDHLTAVRALFGNTAVNITSEGSPYLGAPPGTEDYVKCFGCNKVNQWNRLLSAHALFKIAMSQPHAAYTALTHQLLVSKWLLCPTTPWYPSPVGTPGDHHKNLTDTTLHQQSSSKSVPTKSFCLTCETWWSNPLPIN